MTRHLTRCFVAGIVALLPIGGTVLTVLYLENLIADSGLSDQAFYFPGLGLLAAVVLIYAIGLTITSLLGRWLWALMDKVLDKTPLLGLLYRTLKQVIGYGEGEDALFKRVVLVPCRSHPGHELGLVTEEISRSDGSLQLAVFVPAAPTPSTGRMLLLRPDEVEPAGMSVHQALKALVSVGKTLDEPAA